MLPRRREVASADLELSLGLVQPEPGRPSALQGLVWPSMNALLSRMTDASHQGALQGGMAAIASIAAIIGPLAMTQALAFGAERGQPGGAFLLAFLLVMCGLAIVVFGAVRKLQPQTQQA